MQVINRCELPKDLIASQRREFELTKAFVKSKLPFCDHYFVTTFFRPPIRKPNTSLFPPILRPEIIEAKSQRGDHLLVYQTAEGSASLMETLGRTGLECRVYGARRELKEEVVEGNLRFRPFSEAGFVRDLAEARGVIAGGGFTLMGEAVYLRKPMLAVPVGGQFEQVLNAKYLERLGYGRTAPSLDDPAHVSEFVEAIPKCEEALAEYSQTGNVEILSALDRYIQDLS